MNKKSFFSTRQIASIGIFSAIVMMLSLTPLGFIPVGGIVATTLHIPVIIASIYYGYTEGAIVGLVFGLFSMIRAATAPTILSFISINPLCSVLPRVLIGLLTAFIYKNLSKLNKENVKKALYIAYFVITLILLFSLFKRLSGGKSIVLLVILLIVTLSFMVFSIKNFRDMNLSIIIASAIGSLINTFGYLSMAYLIYADKYAEALNIDHEKVLSTIITVGFVNGAPEMIFAMLIAYPVIKTMLKTKRS